jgi:hypothetical protein
MSDTSKARLRHPGVDPAQVGMLDDVNMNRNSLAQASRPATRTGAMVGGDDNR